MMRTHLTKYAVSFNLYHQRVGHLFQNRYNSMICEEDPQAVTRSREGAYGRSMVAYIARVLSACTVTDAARHFQRSPMRMSQAIIHFENRLRTDEQLRKTTEKLKEELIKKGKKKYFITIA